MRTGDSGRGHRLTATRGVQTSQQHMTDEHAREALPVQLEACRSDQCQVGGSRIRPKGTPQRRPAARRLRT